jgi:hypothetical protein
MLVTIDAVDAMNRMVTARTTVGDFSALWPGPLPELGSEYDVELNVPGCYRWGIDVVMAGPDVAVGFAMVESSIRIVGELEDVRDPEGVWIRIAGGLSFVPTSGAAPAGATHKVVSLLASEVEIYPTNT